MNTREQHRLEIIYRIIYTRRGRIRSTLLLFEYGEVVMNSLLTPIFQERGDVKLQLGEPFEVRNSMIYVSVLGGMILTYPRRLLQLYLIFVPGLLKHEAEKVMKRMRGSLLVLVIGVIRSRKRFLPLMILFLFQFSSETLSSERREGALRVSYTINYRRSSIRSRVRRLHVPRVLIRISKERGRDINIHTSRRNYRRWFLLLSRLLGALLTPPDMISQVRVSRPRVLRRERIIRMKCVSYGRYERNDKNTSYS